MKQTPNWWGWWMFFLLQCFVDLRIHILSAKLSICFSYGGVVKSLFKAQTQSTTIALPVVVIEGGDMISFKETKSTKQDKIMT